jgi:hypothetical protein
LVRSQVVFKSISIFVSLVSFVVIGRGLQLVPTTFAESRVRIVRRPAGSARMSDGLCGWRSAKPICEIALYLIAVVGSCVELSHQASRAGPKPAGHFRPVGVRQLPHRAIELELFDGPQRQHLLAFECGPRSPANHRGPVFFRGHQRPQHSKCREADQSGGGHQNGQQDDWDEPLTARGKQRGSRGAKGRQDEELPRLQAGVATGPRCAALQPNG